MISCKIGDSRLGSMETVVGLNRALGAVLNHGADVINMSYGEPTTTPNVGRFIELANEARPAKGNWPCAECACLQAYPPCLTLLCAED